MADPFTIGTMAAVSIAGSVGGAMLGAKSSLDAGESKASMYGFQSAIALRNKEIAKQNADYARWTGEVDAQKSGLKTAFELGMQKAGQGASGLDVNFGSATQVRDSTHQIGWHDQQVIRSDAARRAYAYEQEGETQDIQSQMYTRAASDSRSAGAIGAATSILGGVTSVASKWSQAGMYGAFGSSTGGAHNSGVGLDYG